MEDSPPPKLEGRNSKSKNMEQQQNLQTRDVLGEILGGGIYKGRGVDDLGKGVDG